MTKIIYQAVIFILIFSSDLMAQQQDVWRNLNTADGLANNLVLSIYESSDGALWFGTGGGVTRLHNGTCTNFTTADGLAYDEVHCIFESSDGAFWFGTGVIPMVRRVEMSEITEISEMQGRGVSRYHNGIWTTFNSDSGLVNNNVFAICESNDGALWFATYGGVSQYKNGIWTSWLEGNHVWAIGKSSDQALWFGTNGAGVSRYQDGSWTTLTADDGLASNIVWAIYESSDGALWFATEGVGVSRFQDGTWTTFTTTDGLAARFVPTITESSDGTMWFGTWGGGVSQYYAGIWTTFTTADGLADNIVWSICEAGDGAVWFGTWGAGVSQYYGTPWTTFTTADGLADNIVYAIGESDDQALWFGTFLGVTRYQGAWLEGRWMTFTTGDGLAHNSVQTIYRSSDGAMWFGTYGGISHYFNGAWTTFNIDSGLASNNVMAIYESSDDGLWFGTQGGVSRYQEGNWTTFNSDSGLIHNQVQAICQSNDNALWFGTPAGISQLHDSTWTSFTTTEGLVNNDVRSICKVEDGALWFGTNRGVSRYQDGTWTTLTTADGLTDNNIRSVIESSDGALWFGTEGGGISRYHDSSWINFTTADGLADNHVEAIYESSYGTLWFGTHSGVSRLKPDKASPFTFIIDGPQLITGTSTPMFLFKAKDYYTKPDQLVYSYAIVESSIIPDSSRWSPFSNLTAIQTQPLQNGTYTFYVKAKDPWGNVDPTPATRTFTVDITPPTAIIYSPKQEQFIGGEVAIVGSAFDNSPVKDFAYYELSYGAFISEIQPPEWKRFYDPESSEVIMDTLGIFKTMGLEDGPYLVRVLTMDTLKHSSEDQVLVNLDNTKPQVKITSPSPGEKLSNQVNIRASIIDSNIARFLLEYKISLQTQWQYLHQETISHSIENQDIYSWQNSTDSGDVFLKLTAWDKADNFTADSVLFLLENQRREILTAKILYPPNNSYLHELVNIIGYAAGEDFSKYCLFLKGQNLDILLVESVIKKQNEPLFMFDTELFPDGGYTLSLAVFDMAGYQEIDSVQVIIDNKDYEIPLAAIIDPPNNSYLHDSVTVVGFATGNDFVKYSLSVVGQNINTLLGESCIKRENDELFTFDTNSLPDGHYTIYLTVLNNKGYQNVDDKSVIFDNTPPKANIISPTSDTIRCFVQIEGEVSDKNFDCMTLKYAEALEIDPFKFHPIDTCFSCWDTRNLNGYYTLHLTATDRGGLETIDKRTYYIDNPRFRERDGLKKKYDEFSLYIPPNGYNSSVICLEKRDIDEFDYNADEINPIDLICEIHSSIEEKDFCKPVVLTMDYSKIDVMNYNEENFCIFSYQEDKWEPIGGTVNSDNKTITTTINQIGIYGLFENNIPFSESKRDLNLSFQPRIFSPQGGGHETQTAISFGLGKESNVTIKIYNPAGRLIKVLKENEIMSHGNNVVYWNGKDDKGDFCLSGLYIVTIQAEEKMATKTVVVLNK